MWTAIRARLKEWYIAGVGVFLIAAGLFLASQQAAPPVPAAAALDRQAPAPETVARALRK